MVKAPIDVYIQTLAGYINDEDKLVTYKWLSKELEVHVNTAKEILADYWEKHKGDNIVATVMLIGHLKTGGMRVEVVKESDLEEATKKYEKIISQHLYSLQKCLPDIDALASAGKGDTRFAAIKCRESVVLSEEELFARRWGSSIEYQAPFDEKNQPTPPSVKKQEPVNPLKKAFAHSKPVEEKEKPKETEKTEVKTETKKTSPPWKSKATDKKGGISKKPVQSTKTGFSALFGKVQNQKKSPPTSSTNGTIEKTPSQTSKDKETPMEVDIDDKKPKSDDRKSVVEEKPTSPDVKKSSPPKSKKPSTSEDKKSTTNSSTKTEKPKPLKRGKKRERSQSNDESKKRKRIVVVSDSSDESDPEEEPDPFGTSIQEEPAPKARSPSPPPVQQVAGKRKVRKMVDKTFVDEEGFMVTKKVQVLESCSEDDEPEPPKEKKPSPPKPTESSKGKKNNKQTSIMSFFKKV